MTSDPVLALFRVIHDDTHSLVNLIRSSLQRIRQDTLDEDLPQKRVTFWRSLLHRLNSKVAELDQGFQSFVDFSQDIETGALNEQQRPSLVSTKFSKATKQTLNDCAGLNERSSRSLLAEMQIVDSRQSIAEAESVSKLTELAFVFIPLSFVASLSSMQIHELSEGVPVSSFVLVAISFVCLAYVVRLSTRSSRLIEHRVMSCRWYETSATCSTPSPFPRIHSWRVLENWLRRPRQGSLRSR